MGVMSPAGVQGIMAGLQMLAGIAESTIGGFGAAKAKRKLLNTPSPTLNTPETYNQALNVAKSSAYGEVPGVSEAKALSEEALASSLNAAGRYSTSPSDIMALSTMLYAKTLGQARNLAQYSAQYKAEQLARLQQQYNEGTNIEMAKFQVNELDPYTRKMNLYSSMYQNNMNLVNAGLSNIAGGTGAYGASRTIPGEQGFWPWSKP